MEQEDQDVHVVYNLVLPKDSTIGGVMTRGARTRNLRGRSIQGSRGVRQLRRPRPRG